MTTAAFARIDTFSSTLKNMSKLTALFLLCCLADFLFYGQAVGISIALFFFAASIISILTAKKEISKRKLAISLFIVLASVVPVIEAANWLSALIAITGTLSVSIYLRTTMPFDLEQSAYGILALLVRLPFSFLGNLPRLQRSLNFKKLTPLYKGNWHKWAMPLLLSFVFITLFTYANPIIAGWVSQIEFGFIFEFLTPTKLAFWLAAATISWPFIHPYLRKTRHKAKPKKSRKVILSKWLDKHNIALTLVLFNAVFGVQTALDVTYIWSGAEPPAGVTYSQYVHQGTYLLIITSLLAAAFILYVTHESKNYHSNPLVKMMLLVWTAQNVLLVLSTISRMEIYITDYSLTELRIWALIWMLLVAIGLILIFFKLFMNKTNNWLIKGNIISLIITMYAVSMTNMPYAIADYNLNIAKPSLVKIDTIYIAELGAETIPAIDTYLKGFSKDEKLTYRNQRLIKIRSKFAIGVKHDNSNWRQWSFRRHRLQSYLKHTETNFE